jgi:predicted DCC family thiol-disulfide oxidoreductase YuxK
MIVCMERLVALYDGHCRFCTRSAKQLARLVGASRLETRSFQDDGVLAAFPGVSYDDCMKRLHVVAPGGRVYAGAAAVARAFRTLPVVGLFAYLYYVPGVRQISELVYRWIAGRRYRLFGKTEPCEDGTCKLHEF